MPEQIHVFENEVKALNHVKEVLSKENKSIEELNAEYLSLSKSYEKLLGDARVITNISDRLQNRLNKANEELKASAVVIKRKNELLQNTIDELVKAKIGRRATTIVFMAAILLFVVSEIFLEPIVDSYFQNNYLINIAIKGSIALLLKPIDILVEWYLRREVMRKANAHKYYKQFQE